MLYSSCTLISLNGFPSKTLKPSCDPQSSTSSEMSLALVAALRTCTADSLPDLVEGKQLPVPPGTSIDKWVESEFWRLLLCHPTRAILQDFLPLWAGTSNELCPYQWRASACFRRTSVQGLEDVWAHRGMCSARFPAIVSTEFLSLVPCPDGAPG